MFSVLKLLPFFFFFLFLFFPLKNENFAVESGKQPITFENPMYATRDSGAGGTSEVTVIQPTQVREA